MAFIHHLKPLYVKVRREIIIFAVQIEIAMYKTIIRTVFRLIVSPKAAWQSIAGREENHQEFLNGFLYPVFGVVALASFVGGLWFVPDGSLQSALKQTIVNTVTVFGGFYLSAYVLNELAPRLNLVKSLLDWQRFAGYASIVVYLLFVILAFAPEFVIARLLVFYTVYIVFAGADAFWDIPDGSTMNFTVTASSLLILAPLSIYGILGLLIR